MAGGSPQNTETTNITTYLIPLKLVFDASDNSSVCGSAPVTFDANKVLPNGETVVQNVISSPIFTPVTFTQGGGVLQYIDAFQRANFWLKYVQSNPNYHLELKLTANSVLQVPYLEVSSAHGLAEKDQLGNLDGGCVGMVTDWNWFEAEILLYISSLSQVQPNTLPIFLTDDAFLSPANTGFHLSNGALDPQSYIWAVYSDGSCPHGQNGLCFAQDVAGLSHEVGEWADDPNGHTPSPCGTSFLEVGDPLDAPQYFYTYTGANNNFIYHLQDLVMLPYFGAPTGTSWNNWTTFQGENLTYCVNGG